MKLSIYKSATISEKIEKNEKFKNLQKSIFLKKYDSYSKTVFTN